MAVAAAGVVRQLFLPQSVPWESGGQDLIRPESIHSFPFCLSIVKTPTPPHLTSPEFTWRVVGYHRI